MSEHGEVALQDRLRFQAIKTFWKTVNANAILFRQIRPSHAKTNVASLTKDEKEV